MEKIEDDNIQSIINDNTGIKQRTIIVVASYINGSLSLHLDKNIKLEEKDKQSIISQDSFKSIKELELIYDVNSITNKLAIDQIDYLRNELIEASSREEIKDNLSPKIEDSGTSLSQYESLEENEEWWGLNSRVKNQKLSHDQIKYIKSIIHNKELNIKQIWTKFNISISWVWRIKRMKLSEVERKPIKQIIKLTLSQKKGLTKAINNTLKTTNYSIDCKEITQEVNNDLETYYPTYFIRKFMKEKLNYSYKRIKSRPNNINLDRIKSIRSLYATKLKQTITSSTLIINIDESSLNRHMKYNYGWSLKGVPWETKNSPFSNSASLWLAICSNGAWISLISNETINSIKFMLFLDHLHSWLKSFNNFGYDEVLLILDNWSYHKSNVCKHRLIWCSFKVLYLPPYTPQWAPIENGFGLIKKILWRKFKEQTLNLSLKSSYDTILSAMKELDSSIIKRMFERMLKLIGINIHSNDLMHSL